jgi:hypothetical protein
MSKRINVMIDEDTWGFLGRIRSFMITILCDVVADAPLHAAANSRTFSTR